MDKKSYTFTVRASWVRYGLVGLVTALIVAPLSAGAANRFTDVPDTNVFHDDITWLADAGVTLGCNPPTNDRFCPTNTVTRQTMAAFLKRLSVNKVVDAATAVNAEHADHATAADSAATATMADSATNADDAVEADRVDGLHGWMLHNTSWASINETAVAITSGSDTALGTLDFSLAAAGDVLLHADVAIGDSSIAAWIDAWIQIDDTTCVDGAASALEETFVFTQGGAWDIANLSFQRVATNLSAGAHTATLCVNDYSGNGGNPTAYRPSVIATYAHTAPVTVAGLAEAPPNPGE